MCVTCVGDSFCSPVFCVFNVPNLAPLLVDLLFLNRLILNRFLRKTQKSTVYQVYRYNRWYSR